VPTLAGAGTRLLSTSAGNDLYHPIQAMLIGALVPTIAYKLHY
jgi:Amt family ammonium transporter